MGFIQRLSRSALVTALGAVGCIEGASPIVGREGEESAGGTGAGVLVPSVAESMTYSVPVARVVGPATICGDARLPVDETGRATCTAFIVPPVSTQSAADCDCSAFGRTEPDEAARATAVEHFFLTGQCDGQSPVPCDDLCVCQTPQLEGDDWRECVSESSPSFSRPGWCYVSPERGVGTSEALGECEGGEPWRVRLLGDSVAIGGYMLFGCHEAVRIEGQEVTRQAALGERCLPALENLASFGTFALSDVTLITDTPECASGLCLVNHFQGRVSCPYGNDADAAFSSDQCFLPGSDEVVTVPVGAQFRDRPSDASVICSCQCDGPGPGPFCECPEAMQCVPLIGAVDLPGDARLVGSYCVPDGEAFDSTRPPLSTNLCSDTIPDCGDERPY